MPIFTFINKMDREAQDPFQLLEDIESELGIKTYMPARVSENGSIVLNAKLFSDIIRRLDSENIEIECDEKCCFSSIIGAS